jgi:hypothetical protein
MQQVFHHTKHKGKAKQYSAMDLQKLAPDANTKQVLLMVIAISISLIK